MKCLIFTEGGLTHGFGHIERCKALYDQLLAWGVAPLFCIYEARTKMEESSVEGILKGYEYELFNWIVDTRKAVELYKDKETVCAVVDSYLAREGALEIIASSFDRVLWIDDQGSGTFERGVVVNPTLYGNSLPIKKSSGVKYLLGSRYIILRKEFLNKRFNRIASKEIKRVLITMGATDPLNLTPTILKALENYSAEKIIIVGKGFSDPDNIFAMQGENTKIIFSASAEEMAELMKNCDVAISASGQTTNEIIQMKLPSILFCVAQNQEHNIKEMTERGFAFKADISQGVSLEEELSQKLRELTQDRRQAMINCMDSLYLSAGAENIIKGFLENGDE